MKNLDWNRVWKGGHSDFKTITSFHDFSDNVSQPAQALQGAGNSDAQLRHSSELIQQFTCPLVADPLQVQADSASSVAPEADVSDKATSVVTEEAPLALSEYGDALHIPMMWATRIW